MTAMLMPVTQLNLIWDRGKNGKKKGKGERTNIWQRKPLLEYNVS
jgi:hypothetical protein